MIYQYAINIEKINDLNQLEVLKDQLSRERISKIDQYYFTKDKISISGSISTFLIV